MPRRHRSHSADFKRQVLAGVILGEDGAAAKLLTDYEARIAALERLVGRQALEIEFLKESTPRPAAWPTRRTRRRPTTFSRFPRSPTARC
ncbi:MAG: hypothetical protein JKP98_23650 [Rhodobacteraceae bacterium]|jgi:hypothetical protein|nr:hypothetical protein [Paracoccaceae bacterium]MBL4558965.1 hypothetical protein [Paracoccaceae bacterium]